MAPPMPWSVRAAIAAVAAAATAVAAGLAALVRARAPGVSLVLVLALLLAGLVWLGAGLVRRARPAWLWGRYLGFFLGGFLALGTALELRRLARAAGGLGALAAARPDIVAQLAVPVVALALPLVAASVALGRASAFAWFRLVCPACGHRTSRGADLRFTKARCMACGETF